METFDRVSSRVVAGWIGGFLDIGREGTTRQSSWRVCGIGVCDSVASLLYLAMATDWQMALNDSVTEQAVR